MCTATQLQHIATEIKSEKKEMQFISWLAYFFFIYAAQKWIQVF